MPSSHEFDPTPASWPVRAYYTPVSDALRGRLSGRLDIRPVIAAAGLPVPLAGLVYQVARRSRLWHGEKVDVARELCAHFDDALTAGRSVEQLIADFGSPKLAARLIRQAKLRNRPWWWQGYYYLRRALLMAMILGLILYTALLARYYASRPSITHNYWDEINQSREVADEERAWPLYREAAVKLGGHLKGEFAVWVEEGPRGGHWPEVVAELELRREVLELARRGAQKAKLGLYLGDTSDLEALRTAGCRWFVGANAASAKSNSELLGLDLTPVSAICELAQLLVADARRAAVAGDGATTLADLTAVIAMSEQINQPHGTITEQLIACGTFNLAMQATGYILAETPQALTDVQLSALSERIAQCGDDSFSPDFSAERMIFEDVLQRAYTNDGQGSGRVTRQGLELFERMWKDSPRSDAAEFFKQRDALLRFPIGAGLGQFIGTRHENQLLFDSLLQEHVAAYQGPPWLWDPAAIDAFHKRYSETIHWSASGKLKYLPVSLMMPAVNTFYQAQQRALQQRDGALVAIALVLWQRHRGDWPQRLDELVPDLLPAIPLDRFDGQPLRYTIRDGHPIVYSIGSNRLDDGGTPPFTDGVMFSFGRLTPEMLEWYQSQKQSAGDWILWPPTTPTGMPD